MDQIAPGIHCLALRTPTLPPAQHTNAWLVGTGRVTVIDPASPFPHERARLIGALKVRLERGETVERIALTHHHPDHVMGAADLAKRLGALQHRVPIVAHSANVGLLPEGLTLDAHWEDGQTLDCGGRALTAMHTPGHALGHLVFHDADNGVIIAGDMVAGIGTILIDPADGDLTTYLASLERMRSLGAATLLPAHGPALPGAEQVLAFYIAHRHARTEQIRTALDRAGAATALELVPDVYAGEVPESAWPMAATQITSHLQWLQEMGLAHEHGERWELR